ncbi:hypothetical protein HG530_004294 [Fusarium avenaceum]|nr:hypothetical protein HG530_004294 [Fusarium avenaceum]
MSLSGSTIGSLSSTAGSVTGRTAGSLSCAISRFEAKRTPFLPPVCSGCFSLMFDLAGADFKADDAGVGSAGVGFTTIRPMPSSKARLDAELLFKLEHSLAVVICHNATSISTILVLVIFFVVLEAFIAILKFVIAVSLLKLELGDDCTDFA